MTSAPTPIWHAVEGRDRWHEVEVLASPDDFANGRSIAIVETFGSGWYANAMPPLADGTSSMIRGGAYGDNVEAAKAWCERISGLHPKKPDDRHSEPHGDDR